MVKRGSWYKESTSFKKPITILNILDIIGNNQDVETRRKVIDFCNCDERPIRKDTAYILRSRGFQESEIPKLQNPISF